jgi:hypothetical protein
MSESVFKGYQPAFATGRRGGRSQGFSTPVARTQNTNPEAVRQMHYKPGGEPDLLYPRGKGYIEQRQRGLPETIVIDQSVSE